MLSTELVQQIAFHLASKGSGPVAFLADSQTIYYSRSENPVISLIQGVYDHRPEHARRILRARIFSTTALNEASHGMLKVAAKRATGPVETVNHEMETPFEFRELKPDPPPPLVCETDLPPLCRQHLAEGRPMAAAFALDDEIPKREERYESDRKVAAILLDSDGRFIAAAKNANARNRTRHAEINLLQSLLAERALRPPRGAKLYVTLKCCKMCAGMLANTAEDIRTNHIFYGANDPGPCARATFLDRHPELQSLLALD